MDTMKYIDQPKKGERPTHYADRTGQKYVSSCSPEHKKEFGQFLTNVEVADFMSTLFDDKEKVRILDPAAGAGVLCCSLCENLTQRLNKPKYIEIVAYELDVNLVEYLKQSLEYVKTWMSENGINLSYQIINKDFILENAQFLTEEIEDSLKLISVSNLNEKFDYVIANPPYFKISKSDERARAAKCVVYGQPNIYSLFMAVCASILKVEGQLVFITPRSYTAGPYFRLFREKFFIMVKPVFFHLFGSRNEAFERDSILQETLIIKAIRKDNLEQNQTLITISSSNGIEDLKFCSKRKVLLSQVIDFDSKNKVIHTPISDEEDSILRIIKSWKGSLHKYGMEISTGPVVPFRAKDFLKKEPVGEDDCPLLWMQHIKTNSIDWPLSINKNQYIKLCDKSKPLLLINKNYVILRRFSSKEQKRRLTAAPLKSTQLGSNFIGIENHLNYIHRPKGELSLEEIYGLAALYNCKFIDIYFRTFNGNTQVSATEIRDVPLPSLGFIKVIGENILNNSMSNEEMDQWISELILKAHNGKNVSEVKKYG